MIGDEFFTNTNLHTIMIITKPTEQFIAWAFDQGQVMYNNTPSTERWKVVYDYLVQYTARSWFSDTMIKWGFVLIALDSYSSHPMAAALYNYVITKIEG